MSERNERTAVEHGKINLRSLKIEGTWLNSFTLNVEYKNHVVAIEKYSFQRGRMVGTIKVVAPSGVEITRKLLGMREIEKTNDGEKIYATPENLLVVMLEIRRGGEKLIKPVTPIGAEPANGK